MAFRSEDIASEIFGEFTDQLDFDARGYHVQRDASWVKREFKRKPKPKKPRKARAPREPKPKRLPKPKPEPKPRRIARGRQPVPKPPRFTYTVPRLEFHASCVACRRSYGSLAGLTAHHRSRYCNPLPARELQRPELCKLPRRRSA